MESDKIEWIYLNNRTNTVRYVLGEKTEKMVACIGINPSTAKPNELNNTLKSVKKIARFNGFDGWLMYNVYPQSATNPNHLDNKIDHDLRLTNIDILSQSIRNLGIGTIWVACGDLRDYLPFCMSSLFSNLRHLNLNWKIINQPTQKGHPRHPLYKKAESKFVDFDIEKYVEEILKPRTKEFEKIHINGTEFKYKTFYNNV